jgi:F-type H+-transporting ATPase subunit gamma
MPGAQERVLRRRIASVQNTKKITRAMELIAATRVVKAQARANEARPYAERITQVIVDLAAAGADVDPRCCGPPRMSRRSASSCSPVTAASPVPTTRT